MNYAYICRFNVILIFSGIRSHLFPFTAGQKLNYARICSFVRVISNISGIRPHNNSVDAYLKARIRCFFNVHYNLNVIPIFSGIRSHSFPFTGGQQVNYARICCSVSVVPNLSWIRSYGTLAMRGQQAGTRPLGTMKQFVSRINYFFSILPCMPPYTYLAGYLVDVDLTVCTGHSFIVIFIASLYFILFLFSVDLTVCIGCSFRVIFIILFYFILFSFTFCSFSGLVHFSRNLTVCKGCSFIVIFIISFYFILFLFSVDLTVCIGCSFRVIFIISFYLFYFYLSFVLLGYLGTSHET